MPARKIVVWDLPIRFVHWSMAALVVALYLTAKSGNMEMHAIWGKLMLTLVFYRICWGFIGSETALFKNFLRMPWHVWSYIRGRDPGPRYGHNPLGGYSVLLLLSVMAAQAIAGLCSHDDVLFDGPIVKYTGDHLSHLITHWHRRAFYYVVLPVIGLHVAAIVWYRLAKKRDLLSPMITGETDALAPADEQPKAAQPGRALTFAMGAFTFWVCLNRL